MDNHRLAPWCWLRLIELSTLYDLIHIDQHQDCSRAMMEEGAKFLREDPYSSICDYIAYCHISKQGTFPYIGWDNFIPAFLAAYPGCIGDAFFATHKKFPPAEYYEDDDADHWCLPYRPESLREWDINNVADEIRLFFREPIQRPAIVDVDLDFFVTNDWDYSYRFLSREFIARVFRALKKGLDSGSIAVLTIALSPDCCGDDSTGWLTSLEICKIACDVLEIEFALPD